MRENVSVKVWRIYFDCEKYGCLLSHTTGPESLSFQSSQSSVLTAEAPTTRKTRAKKTDLLRLELRKKTLAFLLQLLLLLLLLFFSFF